VELGDRASRRVAQLLDRDDAPGRLAARRAGLGPLGRLVAHVESGDEVVILEGEVEAVSLDERLADAYEAKYGYRPAVGEGGSAGWFGLSPRLAHAWLERDYPRTATRYHFTRAAE
jgi:hypothetical protein